MEYMRDEEERLEIYLNLISNGLLNDLAIKIKELNKFMEYTDLIE